jgi:hypothetical protein
MDGRLALIEPQTLHPGNHFTQQRPTPASRVQEPEVTQVDDTSPRPVPPPREGRLYKQFRIWKVEEVKILVAAKRDVDGIVKGGSARAKFATAVEKWTDIEDYCFAYKVQHAASSCKNKWKNLLQEIKKVRDYERRQPSRRSAYWDMTKEERRANALPPNVNQDIFNLMILMLGGKASVNPPSISESGRESPQDEGKEMDEENVEGEGSKTGVLRKRKWGQGKKELLKTLRDNGANLERQQEESEKEKQARHSEALAFARSSGQKSYS